ncbi:uncharacterized protein LOC110038168 [Phalaenopsis equestris]|uniref:uncharacterized protein LOC110038168 n=1 Tax=Phalaenopsis equestris TaxID=78828 RepID=UPI0009E5BC46|nr:uncharacterized protein LOC110038168 [Phalaenopsis equestris]
MEKPSKSFVSHENYIGEQCLDDVDTFSYYSVNVWRSASIFSTTPRLDDSEGACKKKKKKKKKKGKLNKLHSQIISSSGSDMSCVKETFMGAESINPEKGEQSKIGLSNPKDGDNLSTMLFCNSFPVQVETKHNYSCSHLTLNQTGENDPKSRGIECSPIIVPMQNCRRLNESSNTKATQNQDSDTEVRTVSTASLSFASLAPIGSYSEDTKGSEKILADEYQIVHGKSNCRKTKYYRTSENKNNLVRECEGSNDRDRKVGSMMSRFAASMKSHNMVLEINHREEEDYKYNRNKKTNSKEEFLMPSDIPAIELKQYDPMEGYFQSFSGKSQMLRSINNQRQQDMENTPLFRQRLTRNIGYLQSEGVRAFDDSHLMVNDVSLTVTSPLKLHCYKGDGLLPSPQYHCTYNHRYVSSRVPQQLAELKSSDQYIRLESRLRAADNLKAVIWQKSEDKLQRHLRSGINHDKRRLKGGEGHLRELDYRPSLFTAVSSKILMDRYLQSFHLQKYDSHGTREPHLLEDTACTSQCNGPYLALSPWQLPLHEIHAHYGTEKRSTMQDTEAEAFFAFHNDHIASYSCSKPELLFNSNVKACINSLGNSLKSSYISFSPENKEEGNANFIRKEEYHTKTCSANSCGENLGDFCTNVISFENGEQHKGGCITKGYRVKKSSMHVGSTWAEQILFAAYKLQRGAGYVQLVTGNPIATFEKFLTSAAPVIAPSFSSKEVEDFFFTIQDPSVALHCIWSWYEKPGCYGLEIKLGDSQNLGSLKSLDEPLLAYFVPSLSAIQLFSYSQCSRNRETIETVHQKEENGKCSLLCSFLNHLCPGSLKDTKEDHVLNPIEKHTGVPLHSIDNVGSLSCSNENQNYSCISSTSSESKLIFEFFENDLPHERLPLYAKVKKLIKDGASNLHISGNPSSLECMKLQDLHPSSWYSVAWYPIYKIPDGPLRITFLTYHSLGHFTLNHSWSSSSKQHVVCPVLGMLSYNVKNDGWFILNENARNSLGKEQRSLDVSKLLQARLNNLVETAAIFAAGRTSMNNVKVKNVHQDYNFFLSRQQ